MARRRQRDLVAMMVKALIHHGAPAAAELWHLDDRPLLAQDAGPRQGPNRDRLVPGAESADVADQLEAGKTGVRIIGRTCSTSSRTRPNSAWPMRSPATKTST